MLQGRQWLPEGSARACICLAHGFGEHTGRYQHVGAFFAERGYAVIAFDQRGHGRSPGRRGEISSYELLLDDIERLLAEGRRRSPTLPLFLYGHSMGGGEVLNYLLKRKPKLTGVIATSPWLTLFRPPPINQLRLAELLNFIVPKVSLPRGQLDSGRLSHEATVSRAYDADPLVHHRISARLFFGCYRAGIWSIAHAGEIGVPVLLTHGSGDQVTGFDGSRRFAEHAGQLCTFKEWDGLFHELHNETQSAEILGYIGDWMEQKMMVPAAESTR